MRAYVLPILLINANHCICSKSQSSIWEEDPGASKEAYQDTTVLNVLNSVICNMKRLAVFALPQQVVILPSYPNSTLVPVVFLDFSSFREPANTTLRLVFTVRGSLALMWRKIKETLWDQGTLTVSEQIRCSSCSNGLQCLMADKPSGWNRQ